MLRAVGIGWLAKLTVIVFTLVNTRLLVDLVGLEGLAAYAIIISLTTWIALLNFGMPYAVQSLISKYRANEKAYHDIKTTAISLVLIILLFLLPVMYFIGLAAKGILLNKFAFVTPSALFSACLLMLLAGLTQTLTQILFAENKTIWPNIFPAINSLMIFAGLWLLKQGQITNFDLALVVSLLPNAAIFIVAFWTIGEFPRLSLNREYVVEIFQSAKGFLLFAVLSASTLAVDYLIMYQMLPAEDIATYNLMSKIFGVILSIHAVLLANAWPKMGNNLYAGSFTKARHHMRVLIIIGLAGGVIAGITTMFTMSWIMPLLVGNKIITVSTSLMSIWGFYILIRIWSDSFAMGLMSFNKMKVMNTYIPFQALTNIIAQCALGYWIGLSGILLGLIVSYLVTAAWISPKYFYKETASALGSSN